MRSFFTNLFDQWGTRGTPDLGSNPGVNPSTGLSMMDRAVDVTGNRYGTDRHPCDETSGKGADPAGSDYHNHAGRLTSNDWSSSSWSGVSSSGPDHSSSSSASFSGGYDPSRGW
ncbi:hypothetical protein [Sphingomonas lenta]|uniref:hypothetical protein n=1 Tax=Sphingomonas lenta TaxID=1141887 RepID=UPI0015957726|nr:hypothetical protein [Sphingomonas lenta]